MIEELDRIIEDYLTFWLHPSEDDKWNTLDINYHPPFVERLWRPTRDGRLLLHRIYPVSRSSGGRQALYHPHPWPSAVRVLSGTYKMNLGRKIWSGLVDDLDGEESWRIDTMATIISTGEMTYEMLNRDAYHSIEPLDGPSMSIMYTGKPWHKGKPEELTTKLNPLTIDKRTEILD